MQASILCHPLLSDTPRPWQLMSIMPGQGRPSWCRMQPLKHRLDVNDAEHVQWRLDGLP